MQASRKITLTLLVTIGLVLLTPGQFLANKKEQEASRTFTHSRRSEGGRTSPLGDGLLDRPGRRRY